MPRFHFNNMHQDGVELKVSNFDYRKNGRGCGVQRIATYPFTAPVGRIALEPTLLHALTQTG